ncbi:9167_t:CDS:1, partial [Racocetra fulgida]
MVKITIEQSNILETKINEYLKEKTGFSYLRMAYEKTMWPAIFIAKKHYFGVVHELEPNFTSPSLYLRGVKLVKRNISEFYKIVAEEMIWSALGFNHEDKSIKQEDIDRKQSTFQIINKYICQKNISLDLFVLTAKYDSLYSPISLIEFGKLFNPHLHDKEELKRIREKQKNSETRKGNRMVIAFASMMQRNKKPLEPGRFYYYIVSKEGQNNKNVDTWQKMMLTDEFIPGKHKIDFNHYFYSLQDIVSGLTGYDEKQTIQLIQEL